MRILSLHHLTMIDKHPFELIDAAAAGGFSHCGIRLVAPRRGDPLVDVLNMPGEIDAIAEKLGECGIRLLDVEAVWLEPETRIADLRPALEAAARLGASYVLTVGNDADDMRLRRNFEALCSLAGAFGLTVSLESIAYCAVNSLQKAAALLADVAAPNAARRIDAQQVLPSGSTAAEIANYDPALFPYMQICDAPRRAPATDAEKRTEARENRLMPGEGELPLRDLLAALPRDIPLSLEAPGPRLRELDARSQGERAGAALRAFLSEQQRATGARDG
jgi:sugar phosphate isomerase/epimerase